MEVSVTVPHGVAPGASVEFEAPDGQSLSAVVPDGFFEGDAFTVTVIPTWLDEILDALTQDRFVQLLDGFMDTNCDKFLTAGDTFSLEQTEVHQQYQRFYESRIEAYLKRFGISPDDLMNALLSSSAERNALSDSLLVVQDFERFATQMRQRALER